MSASRHLALWPLVGRGEELRWIEDTLRSPQAAVVLAGAAGVGKTRLASEVVARAGETPTFRVAASMSLRAVPLGAFAAILPTTTGRAPRQTFESLRWAAEQIAPPGGARPLVWVDDAHLLDDLSAGLVLELAASARAALLLTIRSDEPCPDAVRRLWRDGLAQRLDLQPLGFDDVAEILCRALGAPVDGVTHQRVWKASGGNLLYLRELVRMGLESGALAARGEVWIWEGEIGVTAELRELISERLQGIDGAAREALETLAVVEPVSAELARELGIADRLDALDRLGLLRFDTTTEPATIRLAHPLFAQVVRADLSPLRAREIARMHGRALATVGTDLLRIAIAQAEGAIPADPALLLDAAVRARFLADHPLATRLARAALAAGGGGRAVVATAECLFWEQRYGEVLELLDAHPIDENDPDSRIVALHNRASALYWGLGRADEAIETLRFAEAIAPGNPYAAQAAGQRAVVLSNHARSHEAIALARSILDGPGARAPERVYAYSAITIALGHTGRFESALAEAQRGIPLALQIRDELPQAGGGILIGAAVAWFLSGRFDALDAVIGPLYRNSAELGDPLLGIWAHLLARADLVRGRLADADHRASEAVALLRRHDPGLALPWALAVLAQVAAQRGDAARAGQAIRELDACPHHLASCEVEIEAGRAWAEAAVGALPAARRRLLDAASRQADAGLYGLASSAAHDAVRLGLLSEGAPLLEAIGSQVEGALPAAWVRQSKAWAAHDAAALEAVAEELAAIGALLDAAESAAVAAALHRDAGRRAGAHRAAARALEWSQACNEPRTPALTNLRVDPAAALSAREMHIARLAARGSTRREIAAALDLSVRTIGNHINRIYGKLGVADRVALARLLDGCES